MTQSIGQVAIVVRDYDEALEFYVGVLGFNLIEDTPILTQSKRWRDYRAYKSKGIAFVREPKEEEYGTVAVFKDLYGNLWDLLELRAPATIG